MKRKRQVLEIERLHIHKGAGYKLCAVHHQVRAFHAVWLLVPARVCQLANGRQWIFGTKEIRRASATHQLGSGINQRCHMLEIKFASARVKPHESVFDVSSELWQNVLAHRVPRHIIRVVLHHGGHDVIAVTEFG